MSDKKRILCIGLVCIDVIQVCEKFPNEDSDQRCLEHRLQRGGNASNNCTVLNKLGASSEFFGTISRDSAFTKFILNDYKKENIEVENIVYHECCDFPLSTVIINSQNGSRTIIHSNKNLPELSVNDFKKLDLSKYSWIHFEGRNILEVSKMLEHVASWKSNHNVIKTSVEVEKPKNEMLNLINLADVVFIGKDFSMFQGYKNMEETLKGISKIIKERTTIVCAWGEEGAMGMSSDGIIVKSKAYPPSKLVDTLGAGDTFTASTIYFLNEGRSLEQSLKYGCKVAGAKVGLKGYEGLEQIIGNIKKFE